MEWRRRRAGSASMWRAGRGNLERYLKAQEQNESGTITELERTTTEKANPLTALSSRGEVAVGSSSAPSIAP